MQEGAINHPSNAIFCHPPQSVAIEFTSIYPRPSPYLEENLAKFGKGPSKNILPLVNEISVAPRKSKLSAEGYSQNYSGGLQEGNYCYCCLGPIEAPELDIIEPPQKIPEKESQMQDQSQISKDDPLKSSPEPQNHEQMPSQRSQTNTLMSYFKPIASQRNPQQQVQQTENQTSQSESSLSSQKCCECCRIICKECMRICTKCHRVVCKSDYKDDNVLGRHECY